MTDGNGELRSITLTKIVPSTSQTQKHRRARFDKGKLAELAASIKVHGILQPVIVRPMAKNYELVAGERRHLAAGLAGLLKIPALIRSLTDEAVIEVQLIENLQREDVHPMEEAEGYQLLLKKHGRELEDLLARIGKSRSYVYGRMKLLALSADARKAFYAGEISASVALLLARIPVVKLQNQALEEITGDHMSYRHARDYVQLEYMLRLADAPFPTGDAKLLPRAGTCGDCPKRTGNQPELFGDVSGADVCTDPPCYATKVKAHGKRLLKGAADRGQKVIEGNAAKKVISYGNVADGRLIGWSRLTESTFVNNKSRRVKSIIGKDAETALLADPKSGAVIEVVSEQVLGAAKRKAEPKAKRQPSTESVQAKKAKLERLYRAELFARLRPKLPAPPMRLTAEALFARLEHDSIKKLCEVRGFEPPSKRQWAGGPMHKDHRAIGKTIAGLSATGLREFVNDCIFVPELLVSTWQTALPTRMLTAAKDCRVSATAVRRAIQAKAAKKKAKKQTSKAANQQGRKAAKRKTAKKKKAKRASRGK